MVKKSGRLTTEEQEYILDNVNAMTAKDLAKHLNRRLPSIEAFIKKNVAPTNDNTNDSFDLHKRQYWQDIKQQFSDEELKTFEYHWKQIILQFNRDVIHTEELQIVDAVKHEILCNRVLVAQQETARTIIRLQALLSEAQNANNDDEAFNLERQIAVMRASLDTMSKDFKSYQEQKNKLIDKIKGSRDQRVSEIADRKETMASLIMDLMKDSEFADKCSRDMEKMRISMGVHLEKLGDYHKYADNALDRPILNSETVMLGEE